MHVRYLLLTFVFSPAVKFLESMGLPSSHLTATRKEVEKGKLSFKDSIQYKMYSRHDQPADELESDVRNANAESALVEVQ